MEAGESDELVHFTVLKYKRLAEDRLNHTDLLKDKVTLDFLVSTLNNPDEDILKTTLITLELLSLNTKNAPNLKEPAGLQEGLTQLINKHTLTNTSLCKKAQKIMDLLNSTQEREEKVKNTKKKKVLMMQVHGLHLETQKELEDILTKVVKGVLSVMVDVEHQRCTITVFEHVEPKVLASAISQHTNMEAKLVTTNKFNQEMLVSFREIDKSLDLDDLPGYLDEKDSPVQDKALHSTRDFRITASEWFSSAAGFLQKSFYW